MNRCKGFGCNTYISREKKLLFVLLAVVITLLLWNSIWTLAKIAVFLVIAYLIYTALKTRF